MRYVFAVILFLSLLLVPLLVNATPGAQKILVKSEVQFKDQSLSFKTKSESLVQKGSRSWMPVHSTDQRILLLSRDVSKESGILDLEFLVLDTRVQPVSIQELGLKLAVGEEGEVSVSETDDGEKKGKSLRVKVQTERVLKN